MKSILIFLLALVIASPAYGQTWTPHGQQTRVWVFPEVVDSGGLPMDTYEPAKATDAASYTQSSWLVTAATGGDFLKDATRERKMRFTCEPSTAKRIDSILFPGVPAPVGHRHQGYGLINWDQNTNYANIRANPASSCAGGPANASNYWEPDVLKLLPTGYIAGIRAQDQTIYYLLHQNQETATNATWFRRDWALIAGVNPGDYNDQALRDEYAAAGMNYPGSPDTPAGFNGWQCFVNGVAVTVTRVASRMKTQYGTGLLGYARHLKAEDGTDPWGGNCTGTEAVPQALYLNLDSPGCSDAHNFQSPGGRAHMVHEGTKPDSSYVNVCPQNWAHVPRIQVKTAFMHTGWTDYQNWYLSSDRLNASNVAGDATSKDPCRVLTAWFCNGSTGHFDWRYGWDDEVFDLGMRECLGIAVRGVAVVDGPAECNSSAVSINKRALTAGTSPNSALSGCTTMVACTNAVPGNIQRYAPVSRHELVPIAHIHQ